MSWLLKHEKQGLNTLIKNAVQHGFSQELEETEELDSSKFSEQLYTTILDFLVMLEQILMKNLENAQLDTKTKKVIAPALETIDLEGIDDRTVWLSMQQTKDKLSKQDSLESRHDKVKSILLEQLIKNWKPTKSESFH